MKETLVISGFPAVGKSYLTETNEKMVVMDSDSSNFSWLNGERNPNFPNNYMEHIKQNLGYADNMFVSSHDIVRNALKENNIKYILVYPSIDLKDEYIQRYRNRGNDEKFVSFIELNWVKFITDIEKETFPTLIKLESGQYLRDAMEDYYRNLL